MPGSRRILGHPSYVYADRVPAHRSVEEHRNVFAEGVDLTRWKLAKRVIDGERSKSPLQCLDTDGRHHRSCRVPQCESAHRFTAWSAVASIGRAALGYGEISPERAWISGATILW